MNPGGNIKMRRPFTGRSSRIDFANMTQVLFSTEKQFLEVTFLKVDEEKKVDAVREFYKTVIGDMDAVQRLQLISGFHFIKLSQSICNWN